GGRRGLAAGRRRASVSPVRHAGCGGGAGTAGPAPYLVADLSLASALAAAGAARAGRVGPCRSGAAPLAGQRQQAVHVQMRLEMIGEGVERLFDAGIVIEARGRGAQPGKEGAAEIVAGKGAVQIAAHDAAVGRGRALGLAADQRKGAGAVGAGAAAEVDLIA